MVILLPWVQRRHQREQLRGHPHDAQTLEFVERDDNPAFDAAASVLPTSVFEPMVQRELARPLRSLYLDALGQPPGV